MTGDQATLVGTAIGIGAGLAIVALHRAWRTPERDRRLYNAGIAVGRSLERGAARTLAQAQPDATADHLVVMLDLAAHRRNNPPTTEEARPT